jgi:hypothetical protein
MNNWEFLEKEVIKYRDLKIIINQYLLSYEKEILDLILKIKLNSFEDSNCFFDNLYLIQNYFSSIFYKYKFELNEKQLDFMYSFDRDDFESRKYWYQKIQEGITWPKE